jgi:hypothetical protein
MMDYLTARFWARKYSMQHYSWYVRQLEDGNYAPWAHDSEDERTVIAFQSGRQVMTYDQEIKNPALAAAWAE